MKKNQQYCLFICNNDSEFKNIQKLLFEHDFSWNYEKSILLDKPALSDCIISYDNYITHGNFEEVMNFGEHMNHKIIYVNAFLRKLKIKHMYEI